MRTRSEINALRVLGRGEEEKPRTRTTPKGYDRLEVDGSD